MRIVTKITVLLAIVASLGLVGCSTKTSGNKIIAEKSEFDLLDSIIVGKTTKREVYKMYGEPNKNFGKVSTASVERDHQMKQGKSGGIANTLRSLQDGNLDEADDESYKISNPNTTNLIMYSYTERSSNSAKTHIPLVGRFMSADTELVMKALYIGFDDNNVVTERWYSRTQRDGSSKSF